MARHDEIRRRLNEGWGVLEIARALKVSRTTVREIRDGTKPVPLPGGLRAADPLWMGQISWPPGRVEVDWAGDPIEWVDLKTGELHKAWVFVSGLGFSQLLFAWATPDMKSMHWLACHKRMFDFYGRRPRT